MTERLYQEDPYLARCEARVVEAGPEGIVLDRTVFYPVGGGQPGDSGRLVAADGGITPIEGCRNGPGGVVLHRPAEGAGLPAPGGEVMAEIHWDTRHRHMRMHTCLHLLGAVLPFGVTGGNITAARSRLDFDMPDPPDREATEEALNALIAADHPVRWFWIDEEELDARPELIRTLSVRPPRGVGRIRLLEIPGVDLQPCGGTHVRRTGEIGHARVAGIEKKGRRNRRVYLELD